MAELSTADNNNSKPELQSKLFNENERMKSLLLAYQSLEKKLELSSSEKEQLNVKDEQLSLEFDCSKLELVLKNTKEMDKYQNDILQLTAKLSDASIGLKETLLQQMINSIELHQDLETKLQLAGAEIDRLKKENNGLEELIARTIQANLSLELSERIFSIRSQIKEKLKGGDEIVELFQRLASNQLRVFGDKELNDVLETHEKMLCYVDQIPTQPLGVEEKEMLREQFSREYKETLKEGLEMTCFRDGYLEMEKELLSLARKFEDLDRDSEEGKQVTARINSVSSCCFLVG